MEIKKVGNLEQLQQPGIQPKVGNLGQGPSFEDLLKKTDIAKQSGQVPAKVESVKFSNHAIERMMSRGIKFEPQDIEKLNEAIGRAAAKGSKDSLILMNDSALIVSVKNKTVVTVMDKAALKENVFTNIDSTIVM
jgi:flagellar operon protein